MSARASSGRPRRKVGPTWIGGRFALPPATGEAGAERMEAVLWLEADTDELLEVEICAAEASKRALADSLRKVLRRYRPEAPARLRVATQDEADGVGEVLPRAVVEIGPTPEIERIGQLLAEDLAHEGLELDYLEGGTLGAGDMARYFELMAELWEAAPWRVFPDCAVLELDVPALGVTGGCVSVIGELQQSHGAMLFESLDAFEEFSIHAQRLTEAGDPESMQLGASFLSCSFDAGDNATDAMRRQVADHHWRLPGAGMYPTVMLVDAAGGLLPVKPRDLQLGCALVGALAAFWREHALALRDGGALQFETTVVVETPEPVEVRVRFPHSAAPAGEDPEFELSAAELGLLRHEGDLRVEEFVASADVVSRAPEWRDEARECCQALHEFRLQSGFGGPGGLRAWHVATLLLDHIPRRVRLPAERLERVPEMLRAYAGWLGANGFEPESSVAGILARLDRLGDEYARRIRDPRPAEGDLVHRSSTAPVVATELEPAGRWFPLAGEALPEPRNPCPCGSGRAYRKCCMKR